MYANVWPNVPLQQKSLREQVLIIYKYFKEKNCYQHTCGSFDTSLRFLAGPAAQWKTLLPATTNGMPSKFTDTPDGQDMSK